MALPEINESNYLLMLGTYLPILFSIPQGKQIVDVIAYDDIFNKNNLPKVDIISSNIDEIIKSQQSLGNGKILVFSRY